MWGKTSFSIKSWTACFIISCSSSVRMRLPVWRHFEPCVSHTRSLNRKIIMYWFLQFTHYNTYNTYSSILTHRSPCTSHTTSQITVLIPATALSAAPRQSHWSWGRWRLREGRGGESTSWSKFVLKWELVAPLLLTKCAYAHEHDIYMKVWRVSIETWMIKKKHKRWETLIDLDFDFT
mgnify:CR=1 FL=1